MVPNHNSDVDELLASGWTMTTHVAASQVHPGSRGGSRSYAHVERARGAGEFVSGRLRVPEGRTVCKKLRGWYERPAEDEPVCPECRDRALRHGIPIVITTTTMVRVPDAAPYELRTLQAVVALLDAQGLRGAGPKTAYEVLVQDYDSGETTETVRALKVALRDGLVERSADGSVWWPTGTARDLFSDTTYDELADHLLCTEAAR